MKVLQFFFKKLFTLRIFTEREQYKISKQVSHDCKLTDKLHEKCITRRNKGFLNFLKIIYVARSFTKRIYLFQKGITCQTMGFFNFFENCLRSVVSQMRGDYRMEYHMTF